MKLMRSIYAVLSLCVSLPIWFFLWRTLLFAAHVDRLVWFLFWVYFPLSVVLQLISRYVDEAALDERFDRWVEKQSKRRMGI